MESFKNFPADDVGNKGLLSQSINTQRIILTIENYVFFLKKGVFLIGRHVLSQ